jgi:hypothetical protein
MFQGMLFTCDLYTSPPQIALHNHSYYYLFIIYHRSAYRLLMSIPSSIKANEILSLLGYIDNKPTLLSPKCSPYLVSSPSVIQAPSVEEPANQIHVTTSIRNLAYYHDGWKPAPVLVDATDLARIAEVERLLCTGDADSRSQGCLEMGLLLSDMPVEVLLDRPYALHALAAAVKTPLREYLHLPSESSEGRMFDRLLVDVMGTLEIIASSLVQVSFHTSVFFCRKNLLVC